MKLNKPPIVEASITFLFEASTGEAEWDFPIASRFVDLFQTDYPETESLITEQFVETKRFKRGTNPLVEARRIPVAIRAFPADRSRYLLHSKDLLQCILLRTLKNDYPGFEAMKIEAMKAFRVYSDFYRPTKLTGFVVRYIDLVRIPLTNERVVLRDYFTICEDPDESVFGLAGAIRQGFTTLPLDSGDVLSFEIYNVRKRKDADDPAISFRMEWAVQGVRGLTLDQQAIDERLESAHDRLTQCFRKSFTDKGWQLFEPRDDEGTTK